MEILKRARLLQQLPQESAKNNEDCCGFVLMEQASNNEALYTLAPSQEIRGYSMLRP